MVDGSLIDELIDNAQQDYTPTTGEGRGWESKNAGAADRCMVTLRRVIESRVYRGQRLALLDKGIAATTIKGKRWYRADVVGKDTGESLGTRWFRLNNGTWDVRSERP